MKNNVDIWCIYLSNKYSSINKHIEFLSSKERIKASRFTDSFDAQRFICRRSVYRQILSRYLNIDPKDIFYYLNQYGKPHLLNTNINFNTSHYSDIALIAICRGAQVGIDIEKIDPSVCHEENVVKLVFSEEEKEYYNRQPLDKQVLFFFQIWTFKEAFLKTIGTGLSIEPASFTILKNGKVNSNLYFSQTGYQYCFVSEIEFNQDYQVALASTEPISSIKKINWVYEK